MRGRSQMPRISWSLSLGGASRRPVGFIRATSIFDCQTANAPPPGCLRGVGAACPLFPFPQRGMERRETPGGLRGPPWGNLRSASPAPGRSRAPTGRDCEFRPKNAPSWVPSGCEADGDLRRRLAAPPRRNGLCRSSLRDGALLRVGRVPRVGLRDGCRVLRKIGRDAGILRNLVDALLGFCRGRRDFCLFQAHRWAACQCTSTRMVRLNLQTWKKRHARPTRQAKSSVHTAFLRRWCTRTSYSRDHCVNRSLTVEPLARGQHMENNARFNTRRARRFLACFVPPTHPPF